MAALAIAAAGACTAATRVESVAPPGGPRLTTDDAREQLDDVLRAECPRILRDGKLTGEARLDADVDRAGRVVRAVVRRGSGDRPFDEKASAIVAAMRFEAPSGMTRDVETTVVRAGFACSAEGAAVATLQTGA